MYEYLNKSHLNGDGKGEEGHSSVRDWEDR